MYSENGTWEIPKSHVLLMFGQQQAPKDGFQVTQRSSRLVLGCLGGGDRSGCWPLVHQQEVELLVGGVERIEAGACEVGQGSQQG